MVAWSHSVKIVQLNKAASAKYNGEGESLEKVRL